MRFLAEKGYHLLPVMSYNAAKTDTRFGKAADFVQELHDISGRDVIQTIVEAEDVYKRQLLVDDIVTTGATLCECARMLYKAGASQVFCAAIADVHRSESQNSG